MKLLAGDVAVVTGAASGIGLALATALVDRGLAVVLADVERAPLDLVAGTLGERGRVLAVPTDVRDADSVRSLATAAETTFGPVALVGNVAGVAGPWLPMWEQSLDDWRWILEVNLLGVVHGVSAFVPGMVRRGRGHVVNMASVAGLATVTGGGNGPYTASKHAVVGLSELLREELDVAAPAVSVTVVCPGRVATRIRESDRNRPGGLAARAVGTQASPPAEVGADVTDPHVLAAQVVEAVELDRMYLVPDGVPARMVRSRVRRLLSGLGARADEDDGAAR
ncbi:MAG: hypothetical protein ABS81_02850 [Pseudonocardia sp. SCN 72-86]|nr:MAG: hypothetical protein ABS81_02850 [Pseudonocardia sp. SCN 72-86]